jgi:hypothetical protein
MLEDKDILIPKYQRLPNLWSEVKKSRFIESLMLNLPIPLFYFDEANSNKWFVVDGLQRMSTLEHFMIGSGDIAQNRKKLTLQDLEFLPQYNGATWDDLPREIRKRINGNQVTINLIGKGTPDEVKYTIFYRINQGDVPLTAQEIRTALFQGYRIDFLEQLISIDTESGLLFKQATGNSVKNKRQEDLDFISRFIAFYLIDYNSYEPDMDRFITTATKQIPREISEQENIKADFRKAMKLAHEVFDNHAFRKREKGKDERKPLNKPLFEVIAVTFAKLKESEIEKIKQNKEKVIDILLDLQKDIKFWNAITTGTATKESVIARNSLFREKINELIK